MRGDHFDWTDVEPVAQPQDEVAVYAGKNGHVVIRSRNGLEDDQVILILPCHVEALVRALREAKKLT